MTQNELIAFYPQFAGFTPTVVMDDAIAQANARFGSWNELDREHARRLYAAHLLTLYAFTALPTGVTPTMALIASTGRASSNQQIASKKVGDVQITYSNSGSSSASSGLADLTETQYGIELLTLLRLYSRSQYVP